VESWRAQAEGMARNSDSRQARSAGGRRQKSSYVEEGGGKWRHDEGFAAKGHALDHGEVRRAKFRDFRRSFARERSVGTLYQRTGPEAYPTGIQSAPLFWFARIAADKSIGGRLPLPRGPARDGR